MFTINLFSISVFSLLTVRALETTVELDVVAHPQAGADGGRVADGGAVGKGGTGGARAALFD
tara:strand:- start:6263 stop:6448 length:186 start_codon:yes stop_codon:yes gene_type:complete